MAKITKLEIADLGVTDSLFKGMAQSRLRYRLSPNKKLAGSDFGADY
jgi:hypothetical protein